MTRREPQVEVQVEVEVTQDRLVVRVCGLPHVLLQLDHVVGFQAWAERGYKNFVVEYQLLDGATLRCEYDTRAKWEAVLRGLEREL